MRLFPYRTIYRTNHNTAFNNAAQAVCFLRVPRGTRENRKEMCSAYTIQCTSCRSGCFFNICGFNLAIFVNNMCLRFVLFTEANRLHWNLLSPVIEARCHTRCMSARMNDGKFSLILIYFLFGQLMQFLQFLNRLHTRSLFSTG